MRKILIICDTFPPESDVGGLRPAMFSKYLPEFGFEPIIFTRTRPKDDPDYRPTHLLDGLPRPDKIVRVEFGAQAQAGFLRQRSPWTALRHFFHTEEGHPAGAYQAMRSAFDRLSPHTFDIVLGTAPSLFPIRLASEIAAMRGIPWVADFRDIAEQSEPVSETFRERLVIRRHIWRRNGLTRSAAAVLTVSQRHVQMLTRAMGNNVHLLYNGFDHQLFVPQPPVRTERLNLTYVGRILTTDLQAVDILFSALDLLIERGQIDPSKMEVLFVGAEGSILGPSISGRKCREMVRLRDRILYQKTPELMRDSNALLVVTNPLQKGMLTTKLFEYMGMHRSVLSVPGDGDELDELIRRTKCGWSCPDVPTTAQALLDIYHQWERTGWVAFEGDHDEIRKFSRREQARQLAEICRAILVSTAKEGR